MSLDFAVAQEVRILMQRLSGFQKFRINILGNKVFVGNEIYDGFNKQLPFYLFWCNSCERYTKDYPHGSIEKRYLNCVHCRARHDFAPLWVSWVVRWQKIKLRIMFAIQK